MNGTCLAYDLSIIMIALLDLQFLYTRITCVPSG